MKSWFDYDGEYKGRTDEDDFWLAYVDGEVRSLCVRRDYCTSSTDKLMLLI